MLAGVDEKEEKSEHDCLVESELEDGSDRDRRSRCSNDGSDAAGRREDVGGGVEPTRSDVREGAERRSEDPE